MWYHRDFFKPVFFTLLVFLHCYLAKAQGINVNGAAVQPSEYQFHIMPTSLLSEHMEYPVAMLDGQLIFISNRTLDRPIKRINVDQQGFDRLYLSKIGEDGGLLSPTHFDSFMLPSVQVLHYGPLYLFTSGTKMVLTLSVRMHRTEKAVPRLFIAEKQQDKWVLTDTLFKDTPGVFTQPFVDEKANRLYFVSDHAGGYGGADIYVSIMGSEKYENVGPLINTPGNEVFPRISPTGNMFFSSNGHPGFGGLDLFKANFRGDNFENITNLGSGINSEQDDFAIVFDQYGRRGFFSSGRNNEGQSGDIFHFFMVPINNN